MSVPIFTLLMSISVSESVYTDIDFKLVYNGNYMFSTCVVLITILMDLHFEILYADLILTWSTGISVLKLVNIQYRSTSFITTKPTDILPLSENTQYCFPTTNLQPSEFLLLHDFGESMSIFFLFRNNKRTTFCKVMRWDWFGKGFVFTKIATFITTHKHNGMTKHRCQLLLPCKWLLLNLVKLLDGFVAN